MTFKVRLLLGAAAPLVFALPAAAQVSITTATTTPVQTATANSGAPSDVTVTSTGSVALTSAAAGTSAVTVNSNNSLTNAGTISTANSDNTNGVRITAGTANYTSTGSISLLEDYLQKDDDSDGDLDGVLAQGTGRIGLLVDPAGSLTGVTAANDTCTVELAGHWYCEGDPNLNAEPPKPTEPETEPHYTPGPAQLNFKPGAPLPLGAPVEFGVARRASATSWW